MIDHPDNASLQSSPPVDPLKKLWVYTNYHCNLQCSYCLAESSPKAAHRTMSLETVKRIVDEALELQFEQVYFTGGEPFLLNDIYPMLAYSSQRVQTGVLTNGMLLRGKRLECLQAIQNEHLLVQVSLDGSRAEQHDPYRGKGSWLKTMEGIHILLELGFQVRISTTETPSNKAHLPEICAFHQSLGIPEEDHVIRPLARRGFSSEGLKIGKENLVPEITIDQEGVYWHPLSTDADMLVTKKVFPLREAVYQVRKDLDAIDAANQEPLHTFQ
ncbi:MAG: radical SAM protein [Anaerolineales bacterium]|nr:radical SAM protein [Anaerolineales bacterium]